MRYFLDVEDGTISTENELRYDYAQIYEGKAYNRYDSFESWLDDILATNGGWMLEVDEYGETLERTYKSCLVFEDDFYTTDADLLAESIVAYAEDTADPDDDEEIPTIEDITARLYALSDDDCIIIGGMEVTLVA